MLVSAVPNRVSSSLICVWVSVTAPVILGNVLLIVLLIRRRWSSPWSIWSVIVGLAGSSELIMSRSRVPS